MNKKQNRPLILLVLLAFVAITFAFAQGRSVSSASPGPIQFLTGPHHSANVTTTGAVPDLTSTPDALSPSMSATPSGFVELVGQLGGSPRSLTVAGDYVYAGIGVRLAIIDISTPDEPTLVAQTDFLPNLITGVAIAGAYVYVTCGAGLFIFDISNPVVPIQVGFLDTASVPLAVAVEGQYAYLASGLLSVIDVSNPAAPIQVATALGIGGTSIAVAGDLALVTDPYDGLYVADVSNPNAPVQIGHYETPGEAEDVAIAGSHAYVAEATALRIIDISSPVAPTEIGSIATDEAMSVVVVGDYAYVVGGRFLRVVDVSNPFAPVEVGSSFTADGRSSAVVVGGDFAYITDFDTGLHAVSVVNPAAPVEVGLLLIPGYVQNVAVAGNHAYVVSGTGGLFAIDVSHPADPIAVGFVPITGFTRYIVVANDYLYVTSELSKSGLHIFDLTDSATPVEVSFLDSITGPIALTGKYAFISDYGGDLLIVDVSNPITPMVISSISGLGGLSVVAADDYAYVASQDNTLYIFDISEPTDPIQVGNVGIPGDNIYDMAVIEDYVYVANSAGLRVTNVADPAAPVVLGSYDTVDLAYGVAVSGSYVHIATRTDGLRVIDVSNPYAPVEVGFYDTPGYANDVASAGDLIYVADGTGLFILHQVIPTSFLFLPTIQQ